MPEREGRRRQSVPPEWAVVFIPERRPETADLFFWIQFASLWERLAGISHHHRSEYLTKAKDCLEKAQVIRSKMSESNDTGHK